MKKLLLILFLLVSYVGSSELGIEQIESMSYEHVKENFEKGTTEAYLQDSIPSLDIKGLVDQKIVNQDFKFENPMPAEQCKKMDGVHITQNEKPILMCPTVNTPFQSSILDFDVKTATLTCAIVHRDETRVIIGKFNYSFPNCRDNLFTVPTQDDAKAALAATITQSDNIFKSLQNSINNIQQQTQSSSIQYLDTIDVFIAALLADTKIINLNASKLANRIVLQDGFTNEYVDEYGTSISNNSTNTLGSMMMSLFETYIDIVNISQTYFVILVFVLGGFGVLIFVGTQGAHKLEGKTQHQLKSPYIGGIMIGLLVLVPTTQQSIVQNQNGVETDYSVMQSNYQDAFKAGVYLSKAWGDELAASITKNEVNSLISRAGLSNGDELVKGYIEKNRLAKTTAFYEYLSGVCDNNYQKDLLKDFSDNPNRNYPISEKYLLAKNTFKKKITDPIYNPTSNNGYVTTNSFPPIMTSGCRKIEDNRWHFYEKKKDAENTFRNRVAGITNNQSNGLSEKMGIIEELVKFQYSIQRDWGPIASLIGMPILTMQVQNLGVLTPKVDVSAELEKTIKKDSLGAHGILSSIPYLFIPGAGTVFNAVMSNADKLGAAVGAAAGASTGPGAIFTAIAGFVVGTIAKGTVAMSLTYQFAIAFLQILPFTTLIGLGLARLVIILVKIFVLHIAIVFALPLAFLQNNTQNLSKLSLRLLLSLLELPIFSLAIYIAIITNSVLHNIATALSKQTIVGMLAANNLQDGGWFEKIKIYMLDGLLSVLIALFSVIIIYKLIVTLHTAIIELFSSEANQTLDNTVDSLKSESGNMGAKL